MTVCGTTPIHNLVVSIVKIQLGSIYKEGIVVLSFNSYNILFGVPSTVVPYSAHQSPLWGRTIYCHSIFSASKPAVGPGHHASIFGGKVADKI